MAAPPSPGLPAVLHFRPQRYRLAIVGTIAVATLVLVGGWYPAALWHVVPLLSLVFLIYACTNAGLILSPEGIEWYALRRVPWHAITDIRRGLLGVANPIRLTVKPGRYESELGSSRPRTIEI